MSHSFPSSALLLCPHPCKLARLLVARASTVERTWNGMESGWHAAVSLRLLFRQCLSKSRMSRLLSYQQLPPTALLPPEHPCPSHNTRLRHPHSGKAGVSVVERTRELPAAWSCNVVGVVHFAAAARPRHVVAGELFGSSHELVTSRLGRASRSEERHCVQMLCCGLAAQTDQTRCSSCLCCAYFCDCVQT
jgi:hypothetical protein